MTLPVLSGLKGDWNDGYPHGNWVTMTLPVLSGLKVSWEEPRWKYKDYKILGMG
ncbi:MAG: hypothetical protein V7K53_18730 [Nostoc sp.]|uniref:hypothetical protein n=1 Tax=Nostoc sp. TaxID=1180 RepID=UPI002FF7C70E